MYSTQSAPRPTMSSMSFVATTPVASRPHRSPASRPALSGEWTHTPGQLEGRVLDHAAQRAGADVARRPLHDPVRRHASVPSSVCGTQLGRPLLHERPHALAGLGRVVERPEHRLVVDVAVALVEHALHVHPRLGRGLQDLLGGLDGRGPQVVVGHDPRDHAEALGLGGVEPAGRQQQVAGDGHADVRRQRRRVGGVGDAAQQLGDAERRPVAGHGDVGHHRDQQAAGLADAVDRGDHGRRAVADGEERQDVVAEAVGQPVARLLAAAEVAARREHVAGAGDDQRRQVGVGVDQAHGPLEAEVHGRREGVAGRRPVDHAPGDDAVALEAQAGGAEVVGVTPSVASSVLMPRPPVGAVPRRRGGPGAAPLAAGERGLVQGVLGQAHVGGVDQPAVAPDGADALGLGPAVDLDRLAGRRRSRPSVGENTSWAIGIWLGWMAHLPSKPSRLACVGAAPVAVGVLVGGVRGVDGVDAGGPRRGHDLEAGEVPEVAGVLARPGRSCRRPGPAATPTGRRRRR